jgi:hypothetical protein
MQWNAEERLIARIASHFRWGTLDGRDMLDAGIVDQNVETAVLFHHICNHPGNRIGLRHIGSRITRRHAEIFCERGADLSHLRWTPKPVQNDSGPRFCQRARDAKANPICGAGHERHFAVEVAHGAHPGGGDLDIHVGLSVASFQTRGLSELSVGRGKR